MNFFKKARRSGASFLLSVRETASFSLVFLSLFVSAHSVVQPVVVGQAAYQATERKSLFKHLVSFSLSSSPSLCRKRKETRRSAEEILDFLEKDKERKKEERFHLLLLASREDSRQRKDDRRKNLVHSQG